MNGLEKTVATYFIDLFSTARELKGKKIVHSDHDGKADADSIIVEAKQGEDLLEGPRGPNKQLRSKVEVTINYRSDSKNVAEKDLVGDAIQKSIREAGSRKTKTQGKAGFYLEIINESITSGKSHTKSMRTQEITIPCEAGLLI